MKESVFSGQGHTLLSTNIRYGLIGLLVGLIISAFRSAYVGAIIPMQEISLNAMFSLVITLSIANSIYLSECLWKPRRAGAWHFILVYYGFNALGMLIGIEVSYALVSVIFNVPFHFLQHFTDYRFSFLIVLVVSTIIYFYHAQKSKMENQLKEKELDVVRLGQLKTQAELQTLQSKINPHFLYNSLNSIASLIHEDADKAEEMTLKLSKLFRYSINSQQDNMATVRDEMEIVNTYLDIEKVRFGDRIRFVSEIAPEAENKPIPRFLIQPLVENALKHGLNNKASDGLLHIMATAEQDKLLITIADNGEPFPDELNMGYGMQSTYDKLQLLYGDDYVIQISNHPQKHIKITIPASI